MLETTKDAALNAKTVLSYHLADTFDAMKEEDDEAKTMIQAGHFYPLGMHVLEQYDAGEFPLPTADPLATFVTADGTVLSDDTPCAYAQDYKQHMKALAKVAGVKGKHFFHPIRLMLTGEMSGQDVAKQLSLIQLASSTAGLDTDAIEVVEFGTRMERLRTFLASIPEEFQSPKKVAETKQAKAAAEAAAAAAAENAAAAADGSSSAATVDPKDTYEGPPITALDLRVGQITKVWEHPEADKLYCEEIDVGEDEPRQVASGLRPYLQASDLEGRKVLVLCNLKARKMVGFPSHGMVLCASNSDHSVVKLVSPPADAVVGERVMVPEVTGADDDDEPYAENKVGKKKIFEKIAPHLVTNAYGVPEFLGRPFMTSAGVCTSPIPDGTVS